VTIANYHHHCRDLYVNSSRQSKLINFFSSLPLTQYICISIQNAYLIKTSEWKKKSTTSVIILWNTIQLVYILQFEEQFIRFFFVCVFNTIGSNIVVKCTLKLSMWKRRWIVTHTYIYRYIHHNCKKKISRQMWSSKVRRKLVTPLFSARHIARLTWSVHFPEFDIKTELCLSFYLGKIFLANRNLEYIFEYRIYKRKTFAF
jgi:hypothetical protein